MVGIAASSSLSGQRKTWWKAVLPNLIFSSCPLGIFLLLLFDHLGVVFLDLDRSCQVFRTASHCMFFLFVLLGGPAWLAKCPVADVSVLLMWPACCSCCKVSCKISTPPWAELISWYWCNYCILSSTPLQILLLSHWLHFIVLDEASWGDSVM